MQNRRRNHEPATIEPTLKIDRDETIARSLAPGRFLGRSLRRKQAGRLDITETVYAPSMKLPRHSHERPYFCIVLAGGFEETASRSSVQCSPGTTIYNDCGEAHHDVFGIGGARVLNVSWSDALGSAAERTNDDQATPFGGPRYLRRNHLLPLVRRLDDELARDDIAAPIAAEGIILELLAESIRAAARKGSTRRTAWFEDAIELLRDRCLSGISLGEVAAEVGVDPSHLARTFSRREGCTVGEYVRRLRAERAADAIRRTTEPLAGIAARCGYADQSHMTRSLKRHFRVTPSELRR